MKRLKKLTAIILCVITAFSAIPLSAFAALDLETERIPPYCEIKLKDGFKDEILPGEYVEVYLQYDTGSYLNCSFSWSVSGAGTHGYESLGFSSDGIRIKANTHGTLKVKMRITSYDQIIATDELHITVLDTRTDWEKFQDDLKDTNTGFKMFFGMFIAGPILAIAAIPVLAVLRLFRLPPFDKL